MVLCFKKFLISKTCFTIFYLERVLKFSFEIKVVLKKEI